MTHVFLGRWSAVFLFCAGACTDAAVIVPPQPAATGGILTSGGVLPNTGGSLPATGGVTTTGGVAQSGGIAQTGGVAETGGVVQTGGVAETGGVVETGGSIVPVPMGDCGKNLLPLPADPGVRGPWKVGIRTVQIGRLTVDIAYPAKPGSTAGLPEATFNLRDWLPVEEQSKVADENTPDVTAIDGDQFRDVPIDDEHGPYPLVVLIHGTASMRVAAGSTVAHWASRGFVTMSADYPGLGLHDQLADVPICPAVRSGEQNIEGDVKLQMDAIKNSIGDMAFLAGRVDTARAGLVGHSQGACEAAILSGTFNNVEVVIAQSGSTMMSSAANVKAFMYISGEDDTVIPFDPALTLGNIVCRPNPNPAADTRRGYADSLVPAGGVKRLVAVAGGGHLLPTDLCQTNDAGRNAIEQAKLDGVCGIDNAVFIGLPTLFDCGTIDWIEGLRAVNYATTAQLEETLHCIDHSAAFADIQTKQPKISVFQEDH